MATEVPLFRGGAGRRTGDTGGPRQDAHYLACRRDPIGPCSLSSSIRHRDPRDTCVPGDPRPRLATQRCGDTAFSQGAVGPHPFSQPAVCADFRRKDPVCVGPLGVESIRLDAFRLAAPAQPCPTRVNRWRGAVSFDRPRWRLGAGGRRADELVLDRSITVCPKLLGCRLDRRLAGFLRPLTVRLGRGNTSNDNSSGSRVFHQ